MESKNYYKENIKSVLSVLIMALSFCYSAAWSGPACNGSSEMQIDNLWQSRKSILQPATSPRSVSKALLSLERFSAEASYGSTYAMTSETTSTTLVTEKDHEAVWSVKYSLPFSALTEKKNSVDRISLSEEKARFYDIVNELRITNKKIEIERAASRQGTSEEEEQEEADTALLELKARKLADKLANLSGASMLRLDPACIGVGL